MPSSAKQVTEYVFIYGQNEPPAAKTHTDCRNGDVPNAEIPFKEKPIYKEMFWPYFDFFLKEIFPFFLYVTAFSFFLFVAFLPFYNLK